MAKRSQARRQTRSTRAQGRTQERGNQDGRKHRDSKSKAQRRQQLDDTNIVDISSFSTQFDTAYTPQQHKSPLKARTASQQTFINAIRSHCLTFGIGPAGTGKTYCAGALAAEALEAGHIERIILTRPAVEAGEQLGFLPGALDDKFAVYIDAFRDILCERLGRGAVDYHLRHGRIVAAPLAYMRGKTFNNQTFVILDEAQNTSPTQMKMFLTRIGDDCKVVISGDVQQSDIRAPNGLADALRRVEGLNNVYIHQFERSDIVRSGLVRNLIDRYELDN